MAEQATQDQGTQDQNGKAPEGEDAGKDEQRIPYTRFEEVNKRAKQAEKELDDLRNKILEFEDRDKSEVDRERSARQRAESQLGDLMTKVTSLEKGAWVRSAAAELDFHDPEDAVSHLRENLASLEDQRDAKRLVRKLADQKKHLIREAKKDDRRPIGQVFAGQQVQQQQQAGQVQRTPQQVAAERELEFAQGLSQQLSRFRDGWHQAGGF
jgi:hypothetical protein